MCITIAYSCDVDDVRYRYERPFSCHSHLLLSLSHTTLYSTHTHIHRLRLENRLKKSTRVSTMVPCWDRVFPELSVSFPTAPLASSTRSSASTLVSLTRRKASVNCATKSSSCVNWIIRILFALKKSTKVPTKYTLSKNSVTEVIYLIVSMNNPIIIIQKRSVRDWSSKCCPVSGIFIPRE
jgi:hypothetical protein